MMFSFIVAAAICTAVLATFSVPNVPLKNSAKTGLLMPAIGLGTGGYSAKPVSGNDCAIYPECWNEGNGCGPAVTNATVSFLQLAATNGVSPIRIDNANSYDDVISIGIAIATSGVPRSQVFLLSKVGSGFSMGYNDTWTQTRSILAAQGVSYVDALLIHWPTSTGQSTDSLCQTGAPTYNATACRLSTWKAMVEIYNAGLALSIGVSNYNASELQEFVVAGVPLPAINQIPMHPYRSSSQNSTIAWCKDNGVLVNAYSPLGVPDWHVFPASGGMAATPLVDPVITKIAQSHGRTPAAVIIAWLWTQNVVTNPRTMSTAHMADNLGAYQGLSLSAVEVAAISQLPQDWCSVDPGMYECAP